MIELDRIDTNYSMHEVLEELVEHMPKDFRYLEVGFGAGKSMEIVLKGQPAEAVIVDAFNKTYGGILSSESDCRRVISDISPANSNVRVRVLHEPSRTGLPKILRGEARSFDLLLVDGDHSAEGATRDLQLAVPLVKAGGYIVFDDTIHPAHHYLMEVWQDWVSEFEDQFEAIVTFGGHGCGLARRNDE